MLQMLKPQPGFGLDKDLDTLGKTRNKFNNEPRVDFIHEDFRYLARVLAELNVNRLMEYY